MPVYPGDSPVECHSLATVADDGYRTTSLSLDTHTGTHVDAPAHMIADGRSIDGYPPETFRFTTTVVDCTGLDPRTAIDVDRLGAELDSEPHPGVDLIVLHTGWDRHWGSDRYFDHPFLTTDAAAQIVEWDCHAGVDTPTVDPTPTENAASDEPDGYPAHHTLFEDDRVILENLRGLHRLPTADSVELHAYPLTVEDGDGAPVRAVAHV